MTIPHELGLTPTRRAKLELPDEVTPEQLARLRAWLELALCSIVVTEPPRRATTDDDASH